MLSQGALHCAKSGSEGFKVNNSDKDLFQLLGKFEQEQKMPPVESWHPERSGEIDIHIDNQGRWFHEGGHFDRQDLARLFASILRIDGQDYFLVTPTEKLKIRVDDVPFSIVLMKVDQQEGGKNAQQVLSFITSLGDEVVACDNNPIEFRKNNQGEQVPYLEIRNGLWAKLNQNTYYELINYASERDGDFYITSLGCDFKIPS